MKIYTKKGDMGETSLFGGDNVGKDSLRVETYGVVDELNSLFGVIVANITNDPDFSDREGLKPIARRIRREQQNLFMVGSDLSTPDEAKQVLKDIINSVDEEDVMKLEEEIDAWTEELPKLSNFILPGGSRIASHTHHARSICRRAERRVFTLSQEEKINKDILVYLNRLSDWLFVLARYLNVMQNYPEIEREQ